MAASNTIRVRLYFDYPPPSVSDCRMCWVLVDLNKCRVVADLASIIREKFDFSRRSILSLFIEDCYLPHTERIYVVRDNDSIRVKVDILTRLNGSPSNTSAVNSKKKRRRDAEEEEPTQNQVSEEWKKKKKKRQNEESQEADSNQTAVEERSKEDKKKQKKKKGGEDGDQNHCLIHRTLSHLVHRTLSHHSQRGQKHQEGSSCHSSIVNGKATAKTQNGETDSCSDSSGSSSEEEAPSKNPTQKRPPKSPSATSTHPVASKATPKVTPIVKPPTPNKKPRPPPSSSDSDSDSSDDDASSKATTGKPPVKNQTPLSKPAATPPTTTGSDAGPRDKTTPSEPRPSLPSSGPMNSVSPGQRAKAPGTGSAPAAQKAPRRPESSDSSGGSSSEEEEIQLVIKRPGLGMGTVPAMAADPTWRGRGRGSPRSAERGGGRGGRGGEWDRGPRGGGRGGRGEDRGAGGDHAGFYFNYEGGQRQQNNHQQLPSYQNDSLVNNTVVLPSYQNDSLINNSVVFQNPSESVTRRDYSEMPLLAAPPQVGQKIAFKLLELTENYTPEVSEYKEGKIIHFDHSTKQIELELLSAYQAPVEPGKFDLVYQNADGSESVEYAVSRGSRVTERWDSLLEPRLVVGNLG
ncbi:LOW QUALITY PROTEIN: coilin [Coregonus clupeaformis]|uniref:LOW QUALITY PROTEIN: coilin n=1 Tax=Coregonus clupeaformis TaxID=59861 RepID=UPI001E1C7363|nr:LOW QUALITY PROTEIN: coilin [Coregonus clupeaformis]